MPENARLLEVLSKWLQTGFAEVVLRFAEKVARIKCLILRTIRDCNPGLEDLIERERYPALADVGEPSTPFATEAGRSPKDMVFKVFYVVTLLFVLLLVYLVLLQQNF